MKGLHKKKKKKSEAPLNWTAKAVLQLDSGRSTQASCMLNAELSDVELQGAWIHAGGHLPRAGHKPLQVAVVQEVHTVSMCKDPWARGHGCRDNGRVHTVTAFSA